MVAVFSLAWIPSSVAGRLQRQGPKDWSRGVPRPTNASRFKFSGSDDDRDDVIASYRRGCLCERCRIRKRERL
eukprot:9429758-Pyramimonas_sp.AAC.1